MLKSLYRQLKPEQRDKFNVIYKSIEQVKSSHIIQAIELCERTITKNNKEIDYSDVDSFFNK